MFQAKQLVLLAVFGTVDEPLAACTVVYIFVYDFIKVFGVYVWYNGAGFCIDI